MEKQLILTYDEINDTFVGKKENENRLFADYGICDGIFFGVDNYNYPTFLHVSHASKVFNAPKTILKNNNIEIQIDCNDSTLQFKMFIDGLEIFSTICENNFKIPQIQYLINTK